MTHEIDWNTDGALPLIELARLSVNNSKPDYNMQFYRDGKIIGTLDFNGPQMKFSGDLDDSACIFFEFIADSFKERLEQERAVEREACARICEIQSWDGPLAADDIAEAIRARGQS